MVLYGSQTQPTEILIARVAKTPARAGGQVLARRLRLDSGPDAL